MVQYIPDGRKEYRNPYSGLTASSEEGQVLIPP